MGDNQFSGMGYSDDRNIRELQENIRILQDRLIQVEGQSLTQAVAPKADTGNNFLRKEFNQLRWEFDHLRIPEATAAGDTYASYFKATYSGSGNNIDIAVGYLEWQPAEIAASSVTINTALDGVHIIFLKTYYNGSVETWVNAYDELIEGGAVQPAFGVDRYDIAQVTVTGGVIDGESIIQHQFGTIMDAPANKEVRYRGDFAVFITVLIGYLYVNPGVIISGTDLIAAGDELIQITLTANRYYLYYEIDYAQTATLQVSTTPPESDSEYTRFLVALVDTDGNNIIDVIQQSYGEVHLSLTTEPGQTSAFFRVSKDGAASISMSAGKVIHGTSVETVPAESLFSISTTAGDHYLFIEMSDSTGWTYSIDDSTTYPAQTDAIERVVIAVITVAGGVITAIAQVLTGEIHSTRIWD